MEIECDERQSNKISDHIIDIISILYHFISFRLVFRHSTSLNIRPKRKMVCNRGDWTKRVISNDIEKAKQMIAWQFFHIECSAHVAGSPRNDNNNRSVTRLFIVLCYSQ